MGGVVESKTDNSFKKDGFKQKHPRLVLYSRKSSLVVELMPSSTIVSSLALKLCAGYNCYESKLFKIIRINEKNVRLHCCYSLNTFNVDRGLTPKVVA